MIGESPLRDPSLRVVENPIIELTEVRHPKSSSGQYQLLRSRLRVITDHDVELPPFFLDRYLAWVRKYGFALAQPARTHDSYIDHRFVEQLDGITARQAQYVEIGPFFSMRPDALPI